MPKLKYDHPVIQKGAVVVFTHLVQRQMSEELHKVSARQLTPRYQGDESRVRLDIRRPGTEIRVDQGKRTGSEYVEFGVGCSCHSTSVSRSEISFRGRQSAVLISRVKKSSCVYWNIVRGVRQGVWGTNSFFVW